MENLRAYMLVSAIQGFCAASDFLFEPAGVESDASTAEQVIENGFLMQFRNPEDREKAIAEVRSAGSVRSYQPHDFEPAPPKVSIPAEAVAAAETPAPAVKETLTFHGHR